MFNEVEIIDELQFSVILVFCGGKKALVGLLLGVSWV